MDMIYREKNYRTKFLWLDHSYPWNSNNIHYFLEKDEFKQENRQFVHPIVFILLLKKNVQVGMALSKQENRHVSIGLFFAKKL